MARRWRGVTFLPACWFTLRRMRKTIVLTLALLSAGCAGQGDRRSRDEANCDSYGFSRGTDGYATCLMTADRDWKRDQKRRVERSEETAYPE